MGQVRADIGWERAGIDQGRAAIGWERADIWVRRGLI